MNTNILIKKIAVLFSISFCVQVTGQDNRSISFEYVAGQDSALANASDRYTAHSFLRRLFMGGNYRKAWAQPATLPVFRLSGSSFIIKELGGGMQTKSLQLLDASGKQWALRTTDKDVEDAMPGWAKNTIAQKLSQDLISASFPYGSLIAGQLAKAAGISAARPQAFFVADDTALGIYQAIFANTICTLEERDPGFDSTINSVELLLNLHKDNNHFVDQKLLLKARLLDMLLGDWDRHEDNWRWGVKDSGGNHYYKAIPRDRDWAFYKSNGLIPKIAQLTTALRFLVPFKPKISGLKNLSYKAWLFDKTLLNELSGANWQEVSTAFVQAITDSAIEEAVMTLPKEIYSIYGKDFTKTLKSRRDGFTKNVMKYYRFLTEEIIINGSDKEELVEVTPFNNGVTVRVYKSNNLIIGDKIYERSFLPDETHFIAINGFGGNDRFEIGEGVASKIKLRLNGGEGADSYNLSGAVKINVYDAAGENNNVVNKAGAKVHLHN